MKIPKTFSKSAYRQVKGKNHTMAAASGQTSRHENSYGWDPPDKFQTISLKSIAELLDTTRSSARRWLKEAGIRPIALSKGARGAIRYRWPDIQNWLETLQTTE